MIFFLGCFFFSLLWLEYVLLSVMVFSVLCTVGEVDLLYDSVHDEVFIDGSGLVLMECGRWCFSVDELEGIFDYLLLGVLV